MDKKEDYTYTINQSIFFEFTPSNVLQLESYSFTWIDSLSLVTLNQSANPSSTSLELHFDGMQIANRMEKYLEGSSD